MQKYQNQNQSSGKSKEKTRIHLSQLRNTEICEVWAYNFIEHMEYISDLLDEYNVIAMDTEFPGINIKQYNLKAEDDQKEAEYQQIRDNIKNSKIIQIGISLANEDGEVPLPRNTWQFNFKFEEEKDTIQPEVLTLLKNAGINFDELRTQGINQRTFIEYAYGSGLILNDDLKWVVFHGGYDFGYLIQMFHHSGVPETSDEFTSLMKLYFPQAYDLKYSLRENFQLKDVGLSKLASKIGVERIGPEHQAGSDALLTLSCYFRLKQQPSFKQEAQQIERFINVIYGVGKGYVLSNRWRSFDPQQIVASQDQNQFELPFDSQFNLYQQYQFDYGYYPQESQYQVILLKQINFKQYNNFYLYPQGFNNEQDQNTSMNSKKKNY